MRWILAVLSLLLFTVSFTPQPAFAADKSECRYRACQSFASTHWNCPHRFIKKKEITVDRHFVFVVEVGCVKALEQRKLKRYC